MSTLPLFAVSTCMNIFVRIQIIDYESTASLLQEALALKPGRMCSDFIGETVFIYLTLFFRYKYPFSCNQFLGGISSSALLIFLGDTGLKGIFLDVFFFLKSNSGSDFFFKERSSVWVWTIFSTLNPSSHFNYMYPLGRRRAVLLLCVS